MFYISACLVCFLASRSLAFAPQARTVVPSFQLNAAKSSGEVKTGDGGTKKSSPFFNFSPMTKKEPKSQIPDFVADPDYTVAYVFAIAAAAVFASNHELSGILGGLFLSYAAGLFAVQATRLRVVFDKDSLEFKKVVSAVGSKELKDAGNNFVVGGANRWAYKSFVNWDFYPSEAFPLLVYFKETQTPKKDGTVGQIHFFPAGKCVILSITKVLC